MGSTVTHQFQLAYVPYMFEHGLIKPITAMESKKNIDKIAISSNQPLHQIEAHIYARYLISKSYNTTDPKYNLYISTSEDGDLTKIVNFNNELLISLIQTDVDSFEMNTIVDVDAVYPIGYIRGYAYRVDENDKEKKVKAKFYDIDIHMPSVPMMLSESPDDDVRVIYEMNEYGVQVGGSETIQNIPNIIEKYKPVFSALYRRMKKDDDAENFQSGHTYGLYFGEAFENMMNTYSGAELDTLLDTWAEDGLEQRG